MDTDYGLRIFAAASTWKDCSLKLSFMSCYVNPYFFSLLIIAIKVCGTLLLTSPLGE